MCSATIFPSGSTRKLYGMLFTLYNEAASLFQYLRSLTWFQVRLSSCMAFIHAFLSWSRDTPRMVKFLSRNWLKAATTFGFPCRQGTHQLAQKSISTYLPRKEESATGLPVVSCRLNSGAFAEASFFCCSFRPL